MPLKTQNITEATICITI